MAQRVYHQIENTGTYEFCTDLVQSDNAPADLAHFHKNFEILMVIKGDCTGNVGGEDVFVTEGEALFICPYQIHAFCPAPGATVRRVTFHDHLIWSMSSALDKKKPKNPVFALSPIVTHFFLDQLEALFADQPTCIRRLPAEQRMMVKGCLYIIGSEFLSRVELIPSRRADTVVSDIVEYIAEHFKSDITLQDIAKEKGYSYHYLSRTFNKIFNINFKSMLNQYRMEYAYSMLQDTTLPIGQIAFESGFQSIRSLDHVCRQTYGRSPKEMRKEHYI